ncbi:MAG: hypothetical protein AVDCRST_MAG33-2924 [uncultured Thermomicrobiales bacterium]|uniref:Uncharacterized protein n=1 Tax=uncultured Thermomicrobiales bacterium TaxID=1645740 RepID=A0A6J4VBX2_9BACT|nr:MAG: hypothetical protein AVDCRST_MAG33-2924 [uncultured Thermomicrobiales bacterium]
MGDVEVRCLGDDVLLIGHAIRADPEEQRDDRTGQLRVLEVVEGDGAREEDVLGVGETRLAIALLCRQRPVVVPLRRQQRRHFVEGGSAIKLGIVAESRVRRDVGRRCGWCRFLGRQGPGERGERCHHDRDDQHGHGDQVRGSPRDGSYAHLLSHPRCSPSSFRARPREGTRPESPTTAPTGRGLAADHPVGGLPIVRRRGQHGRKRSVSDWWPSVAGW